MGHMDYCDCMIEPDPLGGPDKVLQHSLTCPEHPEYEEEDL